MKVYAIHDKLTFTLTYIVFDEVSKDAIIIDPVLDYDPASSVTSCENIEIYHQYISDNDLNLHWILETHAHADHLTAAYKLKLHYPNAKTAISERIKIVQKSFKPIFNLSQLEIDGSQFDKLLTDNEKLSAGSLTINVINTPGHTPACVTYQIEDHLFTGDALFNHDYGTGRCDFPDGSPIELYHSISKKLYLYPDETKVHTGHDYPPSTREVMSETTIALSKKYNPQLNSQTTEKEFIKFRTERDEKLNTPRLLLPSVQFNIYAGNIPREHDGKTYLKLPISL